MCKYFCLAKKLSIFLFLVPISIAANSQAPLQPTNVNPATGTTNYSGNTISVTVTDPNGDPMTVKLYGRKKTCTSTAPNFTIIGLPDTQFYTEEPQGSNSGGGGHNGIFKAQTQWIANHRIDSNIAFVVQLGDCVQNGDNPPTTDKQIEWRRADTAMKNIENPIVPITDGIPYGICVGNHDETPIGDAINGTTALYNQYFGNARFTGRGYYGGRYGTINNNNHYELFTSGGIDFIHISIEYFVDGSSAKLQTLLDWADALLKANPARKGILSTHNLLGTGNPANFQGPGQKIYDDLKDNPNLFLMLAGHVPGEGRRSDTYNGNTIYSLLSDYQSGFTNGGNGFMRIMEFRPAENVMTVKTYSPYANLSRSLPAYPSSDFTIPVTFSCPFALIGTNASVASGSSTTFTWPGLQLSTDYEWYITIDDGNGNVTTSTIAGFATWNGVAPASTGSLRFIDTTYINLGNAPELKLTNFTLEAWVKIEGYGSTTETGGGGLLKVVPIISKGRAEGELADVDVNYFLGYESGTNKLMADFEDNFNSGNHPVTSSAIIPMNTWTHVGASFDVTTKTWRLFIGPTTETSVLASSYTPQSLSNRSVCIGSSLSSTSAYKPGSFNGRIDEVRIWNTALTSLNAGELTSGAGLVGRWGLGDGTGTTVTNSISGGANGTILNNYEWVTGFNEPDPTTNASIDFNGVHDYVSFGQALSLNTTAPSSTGFTLEGWVKVEGAGIATTTGAGGLGTGTFPAAIPIIAKGAAEDEISGNNMNYFLGINSSNILEADFEEASGTNTGLNHPVVGNTAILNNVWTHVAVTYNISDGAYKFYANGIAAGTGNAGAGKVPENISKQFASIGTTLTTTGFPAGFFNGKIDEVRIWKRALTQAEIQANMNNEITSGTGLLGRWGFNQNGDSTAVNSIAGSANGILRSHNPYTHPTSGGAAWVSSGFIPTVTTATSATTTATPASIEYGTASITFVTTVAPNPGGGMVQFYVDGAAVGSPVAIVAGTGKATLSTYNPALLNVGSHTLRGDFLGNGGYAASTGTSASFSVTPATLTYVATGISRPYGSANPAFTGSVTGFKNGQTQVTAITGTLSFTSTATATSDAGFYPINGSGLSANNGNYTFVQASGNSTALIITDAILTYTASAASRIYGDAVPVFSGTITGFVNGDNQATATTGTLIFTTTATATSNVGTYAINGSGLTATNDNYSFAQAAVNSTALSITKRPLYFSGARTFINGNNSFSASQLTPGNVVNGDVLSLSGSAAVSSPNVGTYTSFVTNSLSSSNANYQTTGGSINVSIITIPVTNHKSLRFTDTSYVDIGNAASLHLKNFTLEAWVKIEGYASTTSSGATGAGGGQDGLVPIITKGRAEQELASVDVNYFLSYRLSDRKLVADFEDNATSLNHSITSAATLPMNTWVHVGASFDTLSQKWRLFIDNTIETYTLIGGPFKPQSLSDVNACIGSTLNSAGGIRQGFFNGRIDEVRIWNTALTTLDPGELTTTPANLVGRWALDEGTGTVVSNAVSSGPSGSLVRYSEWVSGFNVADSTTDASIRFNGVHDYVSFGAAPGLNTTAFTLEAWIYKEGNGVTTNTGAGGIDGVPIIAKGRAEAETPANVNMNYFLGLNSSNQLVADFEEATGLNHPVTGIAVIPNNVWTHVAASYDPVAGVWNLYVNGNLDKTLTIGAGISPVNNSIQYAAIGSALNSTGVADGYFNGKIDEVRIWNKVLTVSNLQPNTCPSINYSSAAGLLARWGFNENGDVTAFNSKTGGVNGTLISNNIAAHPTNGGPSWACNITGEYRSKNSSGTWSIATDWEVFNGTTWAVALKPPTFTDNVTISGGSTYTVLGAVSCNNLTVNNGGKLFRSSSSLRYITVYGHIVCNGIIGNGLTPDGISFNIEGDTCSISGSGTFDGGRIRKECNGHIKTNLTFNRNVNLRFDGTAMFNDVSSTYFNIKIAPGVTVNCMGDGTTNSAASVAIDGTNGADPSYNAGSLNVNGTLNISGTGTSMPTLYLTTNNGNISWPVSITIDSTGIINTGILNCSPSAVAGHSFKIMTGGKLNVTGEPTIYTAPSLTNNTYTLNSGSTIEYSKAGNQTVYNFGSINYSNLFGSGGGTKSIIAALGVTDTIKLSGSAILASGGNLTLLSSAIKTARVAELPVNGAGVALATITGDVTVERYIPAKRAWRFLSVPTSTTQTVKAAWQENMLQGSATQTTPAGFGTQVTSNTATWFANGFDYFSPDGPSVKKYDPVTGTYIGISKTSDPLKTKEGLMTFVRGDRTAAGLGATPTSTILRTKGILYTGNQTIMPVVTNQFASVGNPYASPVDMRTISKDPGINNNFYVWDPKLTSGLGFGAFQTFTKIGNEYIPTPGGGSYPAQGPSPIVVPYNYIQSGLAFFVDANANAGGNLIFKENAKVDANAVIGTAALRPVLQTQDALMRINLYAVEADGSVNLVDGVLSDFGDYKNEADKFDAVKIANFSENLSIKTDSQLLVVERRHTVSQDDTIRLNMLKMKVKYYRFKILQENFNQPGLIAFLEDNYLNTHTSININGATNYNFNVINIPGSWNPSRFRIVFKSAVILALTFTSVKAYQLNKDIAVEWKVQNQVNTRQYEVERSNDGIQFVKLITINATQNNNTNKIYNWLDVTPVTGKNYYRIRSVSTNGEIHFSDIVKINIAGNDPAISVFPNPIINKTIDLFLTNQPAGNYGIRLINELGQVMWSKQIQHAEGSSVETFPIGKLASHGVYNLEVTNPGNIKIIQKILYTK